MISIIDTVNDRDISYGTCLNVLILNTASPWPGGKGIRPCSLLLKVRFHSMTCLVWPALEPPSSRRKANSCLTDVHLRQMWLKSG